MCQWDRCKNEPSIPLCLMISYIPKQHETTELSKICKSIGLICIHVLCCLYICMYIDPNWCMLHWKVMNHHHASAMLLWLQCCTRWTVSQSVGQRWIPMSLTIEVIVVLQLSDSADGEEIQRSSMRSEKQWFGSRWVSDIRGTPKSKMLL